ncbi:MAG TPA: hypothetical protein VNP03_14435 [Pseudonocardia sp.]|nr:hypothetical protein [Pseudonocardia sp.]
MRNTSAGTLEPRFFDCLHLNGIDLLDEALEAGSQCARIGRHGAHQIGSHTPSVRARWLVSNGLVQAAAAHPWVVPRIPRTTPAALSGST